MSFMFSRPLGRALALAVSTMSIASASASAATVVDRDELWTTVDAGGGKLKTTLSSEPLNYRTHSGVWRPVDTDLEQRSDGTVGPQSVDGDVAIPESLGQPLEFEHDGRTASLRLLGASGSADVNGAEASFDSALPGVDVSYVARPHGVKETLTLATPLADRVFIYELRGSASWSAVMDRGDVVLKDSAGTIRYRVSAPLAWDSAADPSFTNALALSVSKLADGRWRVTLRPDEAWMLDTARVYPVSIDPDFSWSDGTTHFNGAQDCYLSGYTQANNTFCAQTYLQTGWYNRPYRSIFKFDIAAAIPTNATVNSAVFKAYAPPATPHIAMGHSLHTITSDWDSTATWNNRKTGTPWNTSGGGGDISTNPAHSSSSTSVQNYPAWYSWNAPLATVQGWVNGSLPNYGFMLRSDNTGNIGNAYAWASTESSTSSQFPADSDKWPTLDVTWSATLATDSTPPSPPSRLELKPFDEVSKTAWLAWQPGTDEGPQASGFDRTEVRVKNGSYPFTDWSPTGTDANFQVVDIESGDTLVVEARSFDAAGNASSTASESFVVTSGEPSAAFDAMASAMLVEDYGFTPSEANTWLDIQALASDFDDQIQWPGNSTAATHYAGLWFDTATRKVHINITASSGQAEMGAMVNEFGLANAVVYDVVTATREQLESRAIAAQSALDADISADWVEVSYDLGPPSVNFEVASDASQAVRDRAAAEAAVGSVPTTVAITSDPHAPPVEQRCDRAVVLLPAVDQSFEKSVCDPPLRGGTVLFGSVLSACTAGFVVKSNDDDRKFILTAGHCLNGSRGTDVSTAGTNKRNWLIGSRHGVAEQKRTGMDAALLGIRYPDALKPKPWVFAQFTYGTYPDGDDPDSQGFVGKNEEWALERSSRSQKNEILCMSGATRGGRCGIVRKLGTRGGNADQVRMCPDSKPSLGTKGGDSGGPFFSKNSGEMSTAHGTLIGLADGNKPCISVIQSTVKAEARFNVKVWGETRAQPNGYQGPGGLPDCGRFSCQP